MPISGSGRTVWILGRGVREIDQQLLYSAAWLDDPRPVGKRIVRVRALDPVVLPRASVHCGQALPSDAPGPGRPIR